MLITLLLGCAVHARAVGLVLPDTEPTTIRTPEGQELHLALSADSAPLPYLHDCIVVVEGPRLGRRIVVRDWHVQDAGDGSGGFVGVLRVHGGRLLIDDRNSGTTLLVDDVAGAQLRAYAGQSVLLIGHVTGGNLVMPVAWRLLAPGASTTAPVPPPPR